MFFFFFFWFWVRLWEKFRLGLELIYLSEFG
jgi:hypothetical protein